MTRFLSTTAAVAALTMPATFAMGQAATTFDFFADTQTSEEIAYTDFNTAMTDAGLFERFDADQDEYLTEDEFGRGLYTAYDVDQDERLTTDEIAGMGRDPLFRDDPWGEEVNELGYEQFQTGLSSQPIVGWDMDNDSRISRDEFTQGVWATFDANQDDVLDAREREAMGESRLLQW